MTHADLLARLDTNFQAVHEFLLSVSPADWTRPQTAKWSIAEELAHLLKATQGTARLFSPAGRATIWQPITPASQPAPGRSYNEVCEQYRQALANRNPAVPPAPDTEQPAPTEQAMAWQSATTSLLNDLQTTVPETDLDGYTVWKHPLLGPMTAREMLYFTAYHTERHMVTLRAKQTMVV
jgi:uncharacterized damage-inducible protein DinB